MKKEDNTNNPQELVSKVKDYLDKINENPELKQNFEDFDKIYQQFIKNIGVKDALQRQKLSKEIKTCEATINNHKNAITKLNLEISNKTNEVNALKNKIGIEETDEEEATGLHKDIADLMLEKKDLEESINNLGTSNQEKENVQKNLKIEIEKLTKEKEQLQEEIGSEETDEDEATGLYKDIADLNAKKEKLEKSYEQKSKELSTKHDNDIANLKLKYTNKNNDLNTEYSKTKKTLDDEVARKEAEIKKLDDEVQNVKDLTELKKESKKHIALYYWVSGFTALALLIAVIVAICGFKDSANLYINFVNQYNDDYLNELSPLTMLSFSFSFLIIKLPFALVFGLLLASGFSVLRSCINNYESIHKEIRDISSIYAITGRMNAESVLIVKQIKQYDEEEIKSFLDSSNEEDRKHLKERLKWEQISDYLSSRGKSNIVENKEKTKVEIPNNWLAILGQVTKMIKVIKKD